MSKKVKKIVGSLKKFAVYIIFPPTGFSFDSSGLSKLFLLMNISPNR